MKHNDQVMPKTKSASAWGWVYERLYDTVFHVGDTTQNFLWDTVYGNSPSQTQNYQARQMDRRERSSEKPLTYDERMAFAKILKHYEGEKQIDYWKRQKALLNHSNKKDLVAQYFQKEKQAEILKVQKDAVQAKEQIVALEKQFRKMQRISASNKSHLRHKK